MYIRIANIADFSAVVDLVNRLLPAMQEIGNDCWEEKQATPEIIKKDIEEHNLFVAIHDDDIVGAVVIDAFLPFEYESVCWKTSPNTYTFHRMMVDPDRQGKGIAQALMRFIERRGVNMGSKSLRADTHKNNKVMRSLFQKYNYTFVDHIIINNKKSDFMCFEKTLF